MGIVKLTDYEYDNLLQRNISHQKRVDELSGLLDALLDESVSRCDGQNIDINPRAFTRILKEYAPERVMQIAHKRF